MCVNPLPQNSMLALACRSRRCVILRIRMPPLVTALHNTTLNLWGKGCSCANMGVADARPRSLRTLFRQQSRSNRSNRVHTQCRGNINREALRSRGNINQENERYCMCACTCCSTCKCLCGTSVYTCVDGPFLLSAISTGV